MQKIFLIRHGVTEQNKQRRYCGITDVCLSSRGLAQAQLLSGFLTQENITSIYSSPLKRSLATAAAIAQSHRLSVGSLQGLSEIDFGQWEGMTFDEIQAGYPDQLKKWFEKPDSFTFPQGESVGDFRKRVLASLEPVLTGQGDSVVVAHGGSLRIIICRLCRWGMENLHSFALDPASVTVLEHYENSTIVSVLNETCHLKNGETL